MRLKGGRQTVLNLIFELKKLILLNLLLLCTLSMAATSFTSGDFSYTQESRDFIFSPTIADDEVYVSGYKGSSEYVDIPSSVYYEGKTYWVTGIDFEPLPVPGKCVVCRLQM